MVLNINGLSGQGAYELSTLLYDDNMNIDSVQGMKLRFAMPSAMCSYCLGETRIGADYQLGNTKKIKWDDKDEK